MASLGSLTISLAMDTAKFTGDVGKAARGMAKLTAEAGKIGAAIGASIGAGALALGSLVKGAIDAADATSKLAMSVGASTEEVSQLGYAADLAGASQEELGTALGRLAKQAAEAASGGRAANDMFAAMGISIKNADGSLKGTTALLGDVADRFASYKDGAEKTALAQEIFGRSGAKLIPLLNNGRDGLAALAAEADALGITLTDSAGKAAEQFNDNLTRLQKAKEGLGRQIAQALLPTLESLTNQIFRSAKETDAFGKIAAIAANGVKLLLSAGTIGIAVFKTLGEAIGGAAASIVAVVQGRFTDAFNIARSTVTDFSGNLRATAGTLSTIWNASGDSIAAKAESVGGKLAAPVIRAAERTRAAARQIRSDAEKAYEAIEKRLSGLQFDVDTQGASDRIRGLIELTRQGATGDQLQRFSDLMQAQERYRAGIEAADKAERARLETIQEGIAVYEATRTPAERLAAEFSRLDALLKAGAINWDTYARAVFDAQEQFDASAKNMADTTDKFAERAAENIQSFLGSSLQQAMEGNFKSIGNAFTSMINRMVAEALAANLMKSLMGAAGSAGGQGLIGSLLNFGVSLFGGKAIGGPVSPGRSYLVGERGPEVFTPGTPGAVTSNEAMRQQGATIVVQVKATPGMSRQTALQQGQQIGAGIQRYMARGA
jgi:hypothetical protein